MNTDCFFISNFLDTVKPFSHELSTLELFFNFFWVLESKIYLCYSLTIDVGKVNISQNTYELLKDDSEFTFESRGKIEAKGKGEVEMYFVSKTWMKKHLKKLNQNS